MVVCELIMKIYLVFPLLFLFAFLTEGQQPITRIVKENWIVEFEAWDKTEELTWKYNDKGQQTNYLYNNFIESDFIQFFRKQEIYNYDDKGNRSGIWSKSSGPFSTTESLQESQFDNLNRITSDIVQTINPGNNTTSFRKAEYTYNASNEGVRITYSEKENVVDDWQLDFVVDSIYDVNGCLAKAQSVSHNINFDHTAAQIFIHKNDALCRLDTLDSWSNSFADSTLYHIRRNVFNYIGSGQDIQQIQQRRTIASGELENHFFQEERYDDAGRQIHRFYHRFDEQDSIIVNRTYIAEGYPLVVDEWRVRYLSGGPSYRIVKDSFAYQFEDGLLKEQVEFQFRNAELESQRKTVYDYYCNGQLKSETIIFETGHQNRTRYEYLGNVDCGLTQENANLTIFPNPTSGKVFVQSNILDAKDAQYQLYSITGLLLGSGEFSRSSIPTEIDLPADFGNGYYVLKLYTDDIVVAEKFVLLH